MRRLTSLPAETDACLACMQLLVRQVLDQAAKHMRACKRCLVLDYLAALQYMGMAHAAIHGKNAGMPGEFTRSCEGGSTLLSTVLVARQHQRGCPAGHLTEAHLRNWMSGPTCTHCSHGGACRAAKGSRAPCRWPLQVQAMNRQ